MLTSKLDFELITRVCATRPKADHAIEQYLMTAESLYTQLNLVGAFLKGKKVIFIGDDDHMSILLSKLFDIQATVLEIDSRIISNQQKLAFDLGLANHQIHKYDVNEEINIQDFNSFDCFYINPPYGSKNQGYGSLVWLKRSFNCLKVEGFGILILPIDFEYQWSIKNISRIQNFITQNNAAIVSIDNNVHTYEDLPDPNLRSSNLWIYKTDSEITELPVLELSASLYR